MSRYLDGIMEASPARADIEKLMRLQHRTTNLGTLCDSSDEFVAAAAKSRQWESSERVSDQMIEAMHALLGALVDATASEDATEQQLVLSMLGLARRNALLILPEAANGPASVSAAFAG